MTILETERLCLREISLAHDTKFILELLNSPGFIKYIGDRGVRTLDQAREAIEHRYRQSYRDHGYGLYTVQLKGSRIPIGICGFVRRDSLPGPDIGFAFLPQYQKRGYGYESAAAIMDYGREILDFPAVLAITSQDNEVSIQLLSKLGFSFSRDIEMPNGEILRLFACDLLGAGAANGTKQPLLRNDAS